MLRAPPLSPPDFSSIPTRRTPLIPLLGSGHSPTPFRPLPPHTFKGRDQGWSVSPLYPSLKPAPPHAAHSALLPVSLIIILPPVNQQNLQNPLVEGKGGTTWSKSFTAMGKWRRNLKFGVTGTKKGVCSPKPTLQGSTGMERDVLGGIFLPRPVPQELASGSLSKEADVGVGWSHGPELSLPVCVVRGNT